jgi:hypothetical protein
MVIFQFSFQIPQESKLFQSDGDLRQPGPFAPRLEGHRANSEDFAKKGETMM